MRAEHVVEGLRRLLGDEPSLQIPDDAGQPWLTVKYGDDPNDLYGVLKATVADRRVIVKVNPARGIGQTLIPWIIEQQDISLPAPYGSFQAAAETSDTGVREPAAYLLPALVDVRPHEIGRFEAGGQTALVLEDLGAIDGLDASGAIERWPTEHIESALQSAAAFHAATVGRDYAWTIQRPSTSTLAADADLWRSILTDAAQRLPEVVPAGTLAGRLAIIDTIDQWHPAKDAMPACLVHNDFNQRNVGFRGSGEVVVLDWELARVNTPQRDVAELLTFTLDAHTEVDEVLHLLATHWQALSDNGLDVDPELYAAAAAAEFRVQAIDRVGMQLIFGAAFDLPYLTRINRTVDHLVAVTGE
ncbi:MAG: aminoglycoside phosphotransferase family protein [Candidatus Nanopelagicales bacterium]|nr:aminoglycoside phosphotransferase family protein [Candidatus Nanopelagicales bacterium]